MNNGVKRYASEKYVNDRVVQSDWNVNDESNPAFIKNRLCYEYENPNKIIYEGTLVAEGDSSYQMLVFEKEKDFTPILEKGAEYTITVGDVTTSNIVCSEYNGHYEIMSFSEPFVLAYYDGYSIQTTNSTTTPLTIGESYNVKIEDTRDVIRKYLDEKYLPINLGRSGEGIHTWLLGEDNVSTGSEDFIVGKHNTSDSVWGITVGAYNQSDGQSSIVVGGENNTKGYASATFGKNLLTSSSMQHVIGQYNIEDAANYPTNPGKYVHIVGNGTSSSDRSNAHTLDWDGNAWYQGSIEATALILKSPNGTRFSITVGDDGVLTATEIEETTES